MGKFFTNFEILLKSILKPKQMRDLIEEREQAKDDENRREHSYKYNFNSIDEFLLERFPDAKIEQYNEEITQLDGQEVLISTAVFFKSVRLIDNITHCSSMY